MSSTKRILVDLAFSLNNDSDHVLQHVLLGSIWSSNVKTTIDGHDSIQLEC